MLPVLGGEVEEGEQDIGILLQIAAFLGRAMDTTDLVRVRMVGVRVCDDCVRLPHTAMVPTLAS
jgi:hypothetical protein